MTSQKMAKKQVFRQLLTIGMWKSSPLDWFVIWASLRVFWGIIQYILSSSYLASFFSSLMPLSGLERDQIFDPDPDFSYFCGILIKVGSEVIGFTSPAKWHFLVSIKLKLTMIVGFGLRTFSLSEFPKMRVTSAHRP